MLSPLSSLPQELIDSITKYLHIGDLSSLSKTSKGFRFGTLPFLFSHISMTFEGDSNGKRNGEGKPWDENQDEDEDQHQPKITIGYATTFRFDLLLRTVLEVPSHASYIKCIDVHSTASLHERMGLIKSGLRLLKPSSSAIGTALVPESYKPGIEEKDMHAMFTLFLSKCQNLVSLTLCPPILHRNRYLASLLDVYKLDSAQSTLFPKLTSVDLSHHHDKYHERLAHNFHDQWFSTKFSDSYGIKHFFYIPSLTSITLIWPARPSTWEPYEWPAHTPYAPSLTTLRFLDSGVSMRTLGAILSCTPNLKTLQYDYYNSAETLVDWKDLEHALSPIKNTLSSFSMNFTAHYTVSAVWNDHGSPLLSNNCSFKHFPGLILLSIPPLVLLSHNYAHAPDLADLLPTNLQTLTWKSGVAPRWEWTSSELLPKMREFLTGGSWKEATPRLNKVQLVHREIWWKDSDIVQLREKCQAEGLHFKVYFR
ncbi:hypothetical protein P154DRAFT_63032 [Amniculicola lignicola CBS 123094]|uniref:F-box domain-containing protein n=1 Tax=Amniculicola lignicola CBS 123094 TaxID=1392246 RepID=A0A6A5W7M4_9PLEO|nr:hypothetical protein P154DRAFT_63032 [Amniculicola lignicola CBS 123094]